MGAIGCQVYVDRVRIFHVMQALGVNFDLGLCSAHGPGDTLFRILAPRSPWRSMARGAFCRPHREMLIRGPDSALHSASQMLAWCSWVTLSRPKREHDLIIVPLVQLPDLLSSSPHSKKNSAEPLRDWRASFSNVPFPGWLSSSYFQWVLMATSLKVLFKRKLLVPLSTVIRLELFFRERLTEGS